MINSLVFPAPPCSYSTSSYPGNFIHIPRYGTGPRQATDDAWDKVPSVAAATEMYGDPTFSLGLFIPNEGSEHLVIYAHPNAVDIGMMAEEMSFFAKKAKVHVLLWEFHGYGLLAQADGSSPSELELDKDIEAVTNFVTHELLVPLSRIVFMGRSIGTGPSTWLCNRLRGQVEQPALLFLQAPFTSILDCVRSTAKHLLNYSWVQQAAEMIVADRFRNIDLVPLLECPVLLQHGDQDEIVPYDHSQKILESAQRQRKSDVTLHTSVGFGHNNLSAKESALLLAKSLASNKLPNTPVNPLVIRCAPWWMAQPYGGAASSKEAALLDLDWEAITRIQLIRIVTQSVLLFARRVSDLWVLCNKTANVALPSVLDECLGLLGSPCSVQTTRNGRLILFGVLVEKREFWDFEEIAATSIYELPLSSGLVHGLLEIIRSTSTFGDDEGTIIQFHVERLFGFIPDLIWAEIASVCRQAVAGSYSSAKTTSAEQLASVLLETRMNATSSKRTEHWTTARKVHAQWLKEVVRSGAAGSGTSTRPPEALPSTAQEDCVIM